MWLLTAKAWILGELTALFLLNPAAQQAAADVWKRVVCLADGCASGCVAVLSDVSLAALKPNSAVTEISLCV